MSQTGFYAETLQKSKISNDSGPKLGTFNDVRAFNLTITEESVGKKEVKLMPQKNKKTLGRSNTKSVMTGKVDLMSLSDKWSPNTRNDSSQKRKVAG